jgi:acyl-CoA thioesterase I
MNTPKIVCIGDSITFGYEINNAQKWTSLLIKELGVKVINCGVNGDTTAGMLSRFNHIIETYKPTHVIITGGTNDLWFGLKDEHIISNIHAMARFAKHLDIKTIIGIPTPFFNLNELNFVQENYSECIRSYKRMLIDYCTEKEFPYIEFSNNLLQKHFFEDGLHPNEKGQLIMMKNAKLTLNNVIE